MLKVIEWVLLSLVAAVNAVVVACVILGGIGHRKFTELTEATDPKSTPASQNL
jgi:hypothetical protein